jgi:hypothetical protein
VEWSKLESDGTQFYCAPVGKTGVWIDLWPVAKRWRVSLTNQQTVAEDKTLYPTLKKAKAAGVELAREYMTEMLEQALESLK